MENHLVVLQVIKNLQFELFCKLSCCRPLRRSNIYVDMKELTAAVDQFKRNEWSLKCLYIKNGASDHIGGETVRFHLKSGFKSHSLEMRQQNVLDWVHSRRHANKSASAYF